MVIVQIYILKYIESQELDNINNVKFISREINYGSNIEKNDVKLENVLKSNTNQSLTKNKDSNNIKTTKEIDSFKKTQIIINEDVKNVRINNAMATANITFKKELSSLWKKLDDYFMDRKYGKVAQLLSDCDPMVVGNNYCILVALSDGIINNVYTNLVIVEELLNEVYKPLSIVVVKPDEFEKIKNKYIEDKKNNIVYQTKEECGKLVSDGSNLVNQAINIFGTDMVEIE